MTPENTITVSFQVNDYRTQDLAAAVRAGVIAEEHLEDVPENNTWDEPSKILLESPPVSLQGCITILDMLKDDIAVHDSDGHTRALGRIVEYLEQASGLKSEAYPINIRGDFPANQAPLMKLIHNLQTITNRVNTLVDRTSPPLRNKFNQEQIKAELAPLDERRDELIEFILAKTPADNFERFLIKNVRVYSEGKIDDWWPDGAEKEIEAKGLPQTAARRVKYLFS